MPLRIAIDARYVNDHFPGIGRYVYNLLMALGELDQPHKFAVLYNPDLTNTRYDMAALARHPTLRLVATRQRPFSVGEQLALPRMLRSMRADLYHTPYYIRPYAGLPCPSITTLYDIIPRRFPDEVSPRARRLFDLLTRLAIRSSHHLLAISGSARDDLIAAYGIPSSRISVTPLAADPHFRPRLPDEIAAARAKHGLPERYVLSLASNKPHKNLVGLVEAWAHLGDGGWGMGDGQDQFIPDPPSPIPQLVIAGHWDPRYPEARAVAERLGLGEPVRFLPGVPEADLPALYSGAELFAFPSRYEGFGLPPLEAMACGAPVLCCDTSSLPEVVGEAAVRVAPTPEALAAGLRRLLAANGLRADLRAAGLRRAALFSWQTTAQATLAVYESVSRKG
ncbi:MAG TPA: glycosyltransferase family 1 protein [Roseiflexaceae bacterium]|nr:glycosyltransferase family 1 protein [Roseiflexaceae bacterium]